MSSDKWLHRGKHPSAFHRLTVEVGSPGNQASLYGRSFQECIISSSSSGKMGKGCFMALLAIDNLFPS